MVGYISVLILVGSIYFLCWNVSNNLMVIISKSKIIASKSKFGLDSYKAKAIAISRLTPLVSSVLLSGLAGISVAFPLMAAKSEVIAQSQDGLVCYMQTSDGRVVNLGDLCGVKPSLDGANSEGAKKVSLVGVKSEGNFISGKVTNATGKVVRDVKVNYEVFDSKGNMLDNGVIYTQPPTISPGGSASFSSTTMNGGKVKATFVEWSE